MGRTEATVRSPRAASGRARVIALLTVMVALWLFAAAPAIGQAAGLIVLGPLGESGTATEGVVAAIQQERRLTAVVLGGGRQQSELAAARRNTDHLADAWRGLISSSVHRWTASGQLEDRFRTFGEQLDRLATLRDDADNKRSDRTVLLDGYTAMVDAGFSVYTAMSSLDDPQFARHSGALVRLSYARELMSRQDALLAGGLAAGKLSAHDITTFAQLSGAQRLLYARTAAEVAPADQAMLRTALGGSAIGRLRLLEDQIMSQARPGSPPPVTADDWDTTIGAAQSSMRAVELTAADNLVRSANPIVLGIVVRFLVAGILGLVAVIICWTTARTFLRQLAALRDAAYQLATDRLPAVVRKLSAGERVDVDALAPPITPPGKEIKEFGELARSFSLAQETAVQAAIDQADLRTKVRDVFLALARRNQSLVARQITVLDRAERRVTDKETVAALFNLDHLATRMRRAAENLIVLANASAGRGWKHPIPVIDAVRGAISAVEEYQRVEVQPCAEAAVSGPVAGDVIHLLAELIENATSYSPPFSPVRVSGKRVAHGYVIEVEDDGLGMREDELEAVNRQLVQPSDFDLVDPAHLGLHVVAKLADKHGLKVTLRSSPSNGIWAVVLLPSSVVMFEDPAELLPVTEPALPAPSNHDALLPDANQESVDGRTGLHRLSLESLPALTSSSQPTLDQVQGGAELPTRERQANLAPQLRDAARRSGEREAEAVPPPSPEQNRVNLTALQRGITQGRADASHSRRDDSAATEGQIK